MFLQANPTQGRSEEEKAELKTKFTPGENVLPKAKVKKETREEAADRRMVEEARDLSLRDVGIRGATSGSHERGIRHRPRRSSDSLRATVGVHETAVERHQRRQSSGPSTDAARAHARQIEHQSSLRSLLSNSDVDSTETPEEILRQIMEDGILDGIDLTDLDGIQEDELSERIADAYRRRHGRQRSRDARGDRTRRTSGHVNTSTPPERAHRTSEGRSSQSSETPAVHSSHPPLSRPHLLEAYPARPIDTRRRTASETRRQTSPDPRGSSRTRLDTQRQAARSATDISTRSHRSSEEAHSRPNDLPDQRRRTTDPDRLQLRRASHGNEIQRPSISRSPNGRARDIQGTSNTSRSITVGNIVVPSPSSPRLLSTLEPRPVRSRGEHSSDRSAASTQGTSAPSPPSSSSTAVPLASRQEPKQLYPEPSISCNRCGKANIEHELHENCSICNNGNYDLCLRCYRLGRGCLHWFGFGHAAQQRYERQGAAGGHPDAQLSPHRLNGHRYLQPPPGSRASPHNNVSYSEPASRLQSGPFCSNCSTYSPNCLWKCGTCNEGEWGFCSSCVGRGDCCTHPLLPVALNSYLASHDNDPNLPRTPSQSRTFTTYAPAPTFSPTLTAPFSSQPSLPTPMQPTADDSTPLTTSTTCAICTYPIPPSTTRFHCPQCNAGDYDICTSCYLKLVHRGTVTAENGPNGWRRCPQGHRMIVVGFEDSAMGQRRIVDKDLVGGHMWKDVESKAGEGGEEWVWEGGKGGRRRVTRAGRADAAAAGTTGAVPSSSAEKSEGAVSNSSSSPPPLLKQYPPNGGKGMHVQAMWSYWPREGVEDELGFPKGAEIMECEDINGDWFWGWYCGKGGVFPGNYGRVAG